MRPLAPLAIVVLGACSAAVSGPASRDVPFADRGASASSAYGERDGAGPRLIVGVDAASRAELARFLPAAPAERDRVPVAAFEGPQRTGGYAIRITRITRDGDRLVVHAAFTTPPPDALVTQVLTSPAHLVSIAAADAAGVTDARLLDEGGAERARWSARGGP